MKLISNLRAIILRMLVVGIMSFLVLCSVGAYAPKEKMGIDHQANRYVSISGSIYVFDDDSPDPPETSTTGFSNALWLSPNQTMSFIETNACADEVRIELYVSASATDGGDVTIRGTAYLYEGTDCYSNDLDGQKDFAFTVPKDRIAYYPVKFFNTDEGGDWAKIDMSVSNSSYSPTR